MRTAIAFHGGELEAQLTGEVWTVRLGDLEASSKWLDFALAKLLDDDTQQAHELAVKLVERLLESGAHEESQSPLAAEP